MGRSAHQPCDGGPDVKLSRHVPVDHPLAFQFRRAVESLTAAQVHDSARQYRGTARDFLIYLGDDHPAVSSLNQLRRDPHILGWFIHLLSLAPAVYISRLMRLRCILEELAWTAQLPELAHLIRSEDFRGHPTPFPAPERHGRISHSLRTLPSPSPSPP